MQGRNGIPYGRIGTYVRLGPMVASMMNKQLSESVGIHSRRGAFVRPGDPAAGIWFTTGNGPSLSVMKARGERNTKNVDAVTTKSALSRLPELASSLWNHSWNRDFGLSSFQGAENALTTGP